MSEQLSDNRLINSVREAQVRRKERLYDACSLIMTVGLTALGITCILGLTGCAGLYGYYLYDNNAVSPASINTIERIAIYIFGLFSAFLAKLAYKAVGAE
jgi:hypothetical protein